MILKCIYEKDSLAINSNPGCTHEFELSFVNRIGIDGKSTYELAVIGGYTGTLEQFTTEAAALANNSARLTKAEAEMFQLRTVEMPLKADLDPVAKTVPSAQIEPLQGLQTGVDCSKGYLGGTSAQYPNLCFAGDRTTRLIFTYDNTLTYNTVQTVFSLGPYRENINMYIGANLGTMNIAAGGIATSVKLNNGINLIVISTKFNSKISRIFFNGVFIAEHLSTTLVAPTQFAIGNFGAGYAENFINKMINSVTSFNYAMSDTECLALWNNGDPLNYMLPNNMKHPVYVVDDPFVFEAQSNSSASYPIANSVESDTNGFLGQYRKATRLPEGTTTHNIISVYFKPYLYQVFSSFMTHTPMQVVMRYRSNVKFDTKLNNPIGINVPHNLADPLEITLNVCNVLNTNLAGFISTGAIMDDSPTAWIEYQIVSVKSMNCIAEYLPCGLLTDKWRDTSGNGNDIAAVGTPELVYQRPAYVTVDKGLRALFVARGAVWNEKTGFYELNGLTDITERQMMDIFIVTGDYKMTSLYWNGIFSSPTPNYPRTNYPVTPQNADRISCELAFYKNIQLEVLNLVNTGTHEIRWAQSSYNCFLQCTKLHTILGVINANSTTNFTNSFNGCNDLQNIDIKNLKASISFLHSQSLTRGSILYLINNSINTTPITATLHANAKERLTPEDIALASSKNITIA